MTALPLLLLALGVVLLALLMVRALYGRLPVRPITDDEHDDHNRAMREYNERKAA